MNLYKRAETVLKNKYKINLLEQVVLARHDRAIYYVEFFEHEILFNKIHGNSPLDNYEKGDSFPFTYLEQNFDMTSKYGEVAGQKYYKKINTDKLKQMVDEVNITIPIMINNQRFWIRLHLYTTVKNEKGAPVLASCYITDVTKYLVSEESLYEKTHKDELSGLFNRYTLQYHFELYGTKSPIIGLYFDIDDFKKYNDAYGHDIGDQVIIKLSENLKILCSENFKAYRMGGDEFFIIIFKADLNLMDRYLKIITDSVEKVSIPKIKDQLSVSIGGVYTSSNITHESEPFIKEADRLMYVSKKNGKARATIGEFFVS